MGRLREALMCRAIPVVAALLVALSALAGGGLVWAQGSASDLSACVEPRTGYLVYGRACGGETLTWSRQGPQGEAGPAGPKGDPGAGGSAPAPPVEIQVRTHPPKALHASPGKPNLAKLASGSDGQVAAFSAFHDQDVALPEAKLFGSAPAGVAHLDVPAGRFVVVAKADVLPSSWADVEGFALCDLVAGADYDSSSGAPNTTLALTVVHAYAKPGRIALRCLGLETVLQRIKITAIRVDALKNGYVAAG
jgi:hypothetical protein